MKFTGPFLKKNLVNQNIIKSQLMHFSKEAFRHIILNSRCGFIYQPSHNKTKNPLKFDINIFKKNSPLISIYKKASPKLIVSKEHLCWDSSTFIKEFSVEANGYMNLLFSDLIDYYSKNNNEDEYMEAIGVLYKELLLCQIDFIYSNLRNKDGFFTDMKQGSTIEEKGEKVKFSNQAIMMAAFYNASLYANEPDSEELRKFSCDILDMLVEFQDSMNYFNFSELVKLTLAINIFYDISKNEKAKELLVNLCDLLIQKYESKADSNSSLKTDCVCLMFINLYLATEILAIEKFGVYLNKIIDYLNGLFDYNKGIFINKEDKKEIIFSCDDIVFYILCQLIALKKGLCTSQRILQDTYNNQFIQSGLISSWPSPPPVESPERYSDFSFNPDKMMDDNCFKVPSAVIPEKAHISPVFIRKIVYNIKKSGFIPYRINFDSRKNMSLLYILRYIIHKLD